MGAACSKDARHHIQETTTPTTSPAAATAGTSATPSTSAYYKSNSRLPGLRGGKQKKKDALELMFDHMDVEKKGYIDEKNLKNWMRDERSFFEGKDVTKIIEKYGAGGKLTFDQFKGWWASTYTTHNDELDLSAVVAEVQGELKQHKAQSRPMPLIEESVILDSSAQLTNLALNRS